MGLSIVVSSGLKLNGEDDSLIRSAERNMVIFWALRMGFLMGLKCIGATVLNFAGVCVLIDLTGKVLGFNFNQKKQILSKRM